MFERLTTRLQKSFKGFANRTFTEQNMRVTLKEVRNALIEADVAVSVVGDLMAQIESDALGQQIEKHLSPSQALVKIISDRLVALMGASQAPLDLNGSAPIVILMAGLQGAGKTTTVAKLAKWAQEKMGKERIWTVSCDVYRPAAMDQLKTVSEQVGAQYVEPEGETDPVKLAQRAYAAAKRAQAEILIVDTAGRMHIDQAMMAEIQAIHQALSPQETLFVVDGMTGQDAANTAKAFHEALPLTGLVVTKLDGDARGGAILSLRAITGKPVKFVGMGEKLDALEPFHPDRMASRILGMGDMLSLIEDIEQKVDKQAAERLAKKVQSGKKFDLEDFREQLLQMNNMGGMGALLDKLPGMGQLPEAVKQQAMNEKPMRQMLAMINSMTIKERRFPVLIKGSRKRRIAMGSGTQIQDINRMMKQFTQMQKMMKRFSGKGGMMRMMSQMKGMLPPGSM